jgi:rare lipoprotein A (peptidoglycan hydrolase)
MIARTVSVMLLAVFLPVSAPADAGHSLKGIASDYDYDGEVTANGETAKPDDFTAVHKSLPIGTLAKITRLDTENRSSCASPTAARL